MTSRFRKTITAEILNVIWKFLEPGDAEQMKRFLPLSMRLCKGPNECPQFELPMKALVKLKPELEKRVHPDTIVTCIKNQGLQRYIQDVSLKNKEKPTFVFPVDRNLFSKHLFDDLYKEEQVSVFNSTFFRNVPLTNVVVEYSSPNIAKPFHFGHFRSTIIGNVISNVFQYVGHNVTRINYIGDWGLQYGILAAGFKEFGSSEKLLNNPLRHLNEVYQEANKQAENDSTFNERANLYFKKMEEGDNDILSQWQTFKDLSLKEMDSTYKRLGIHFDETYGESSYSKNVQSLYPELLEKEIAYRQDDGSLVLANGCENKSENKVVLQKSDGSSLYLSRDIAAAIDRKKKYNFDSMYYVVDSSQRKHFTNLFHIMKNIDSEGFSDLQHVRFGRIIKFSSRKGNAVFLHDILNEAQQRTLEKMKNSPNTKVAENMDKVADILGISSLIINDLAPNRRRDYEFDWEKVLNMNGNSGITLQYCHARLTGIQENCGVDLNLNADLSALTEPEALNLIVMLARFDEVVYQAYIELEPHAIVTYLFSLRSAIGKANKVLVVKGQKLGIAQARLLLFHAAQRVLRQGLCLLGITPLDHM